MTQLLFVIGVHRSGTTWMANTLCNHPQIFGIQAAEHRGIVESWFFSHLDGRFGPLERNENYELFLDLFYQTPFFQWSGVPPAALRSLQSSTYSDFFTRFVALAVAAQGDCRYFLEKTPVHTLYLERLLKYYPQAKFVVVQRSLVDVARSTLKRHLDDNEDMHPGGRDYLLSASKTVFHWRKYQAYIQHYRRHSPRRFCLVNYEDMVINLPTALGPVMEFLELDWDENLTTERFRPNSSFRNRQVAKEQQFNPVVDWSINVAGALSRFVPFSIFRRHETSRNPRTCQSIPFLQDEPAAVPYSD